MEEILKFRHNVMNVTTIDAFENIKGGMNHRCKDVYFVRAIGTSATYISDIKKMDDALSNARNSGWGYYCRLNGLPKLQNMEDAAFYSECYSKWVENGKRKAVIHVTKKNDVWAKTLGNACLTIEDICAAQNMQMTDSIIRNLIVKMLFWYDLVFGREELAWDEKKSWKIVADNIEKKQEYLFFYLLTLTGCDVLLLQSRKDIGTEAEKLGLSVKFVLGDYSELALPEYEGGWKKSNLLEMPDAVEGTSAVIPSHQEQGNGIQVKIPRRERGNPSVMQQTLTRTAVSSAVRTMEKSFEELATLASSVVLIAIHDEKGEVMGTGSGIMVGKEGYILTNNHVASGGKYYSVRMEEDNEVYLTDEVIKYNYVLDLAIIRIQKKLMPIPVYQGEKKLVRGQKVVAIGSPLGLFNSVSDGIISGFRKIDNVDMIQFTAPTSHGSSGGAVLNMQGEVIGISTAGFDSGQNINLAVGYECINAFIKGFI